ncbi:YaiI/YqxD family protein [Halonatronum saccharophilum]|uniref:YaiI/YqxD family protein n=1 Tax=Halonatronum saccharophilum TaxID=150060 RepID=UPI00047F1D0F|nr:DUF188 domain-containing protein [Halonatronum saccharophilum]
MRILVDGDACPVKEEVSKIALKYNIALFIFISLAHWNNNRVEAEHITVDSNYQEVDMVLINRVESGDIVITNDYGLASLALGKNAYVISFYGKTFSEERIDYLLANRHFSAKLRRQGVYISKASKYSGEDKNRFIDTLSNLIEKLS